jgi:asparagine synthase (glutamine-hydrolysing)
MTSADEVINLLDDFIDKTDQPVADSAAIMTLMLSKIVARDHKIVLSGAGADELFGGYNRHQAFHLYLKNHKLLKLMKQAGGMSASMFAALGNESGRMINKFFHNLDDNPGITFHNFITLDGLVPKPENPLWQEKSEGDFLDYHLRQALKHDLENYLVSDVLVVNDKMAMQSSVEMRMPYLDYEVINFLKLLPPSYLLKHGKKWILRRILEKKNGKPFVKRSKQGFGLPFGSWIDKNHESLWSFTRNQDLIIYKFVEKEIIDRMLHNHRNKKANFTTELWAVLVLAKWLERNFL